MTNNDREAAEGEFLAELDAIAAANLMDPRADAPEAAPSDTEPTPEQVAMDEAMKDGQYAGQRLSQQTTALTFAFLFLVIPGTIYVRSLLAPILCPGGCGQGSGPILLLIMTLASPLAYIVKSSQWVRRQKKSLETNYPAVPKPTATSMVLSALLILMLVLLAAVVTCFAFLAIVL